MPRTAADPFRVSSFTQALAKLIFRLGGWKTAGALPEPARCVIIAAPHTSNWDAFMMVTAACIFRVRLAWFVKEEAFFFPLGPILRWFGGIPIDRTARHNMVGQAVARFEQSDQLILAVPPEATRKRSQTWKTGFYYIARAAHVPIVLGYVDYRRKVAGLGPAFFPTDDIEADFRVFEKFYASVTPKFPELRGAVAVDPAAISRDSSAA